jgi:hypothetical protein
MILHRSEPSIFQQVCSLASCIFIIILKYNKSYIVCTSNIQFDKQNKICNAYEVVLKLMACTLLIIQMV